MGTRSRIAVMHGDVCKSIYCHWDGYLEHNGEILQQYYDSAKANRLIALGDMSSLRPAIGEKHAFSKLDPIGNEMPEYNEDWCTFYGRDRGEKGTEWQVAHTFEEFLEQAESCGAEYYYIMKDGVWYVGSMYGYEQHGLTKQGVTPLTEALETVKDNA
jgi:hypothetical protein